MVAPAGRRSVLQAGQGQALNVGARHRAPMAAARRLAVGGAVVCTTGGAAQNGSVHQKGVQPVNDEATTSRCPLCDGPLEDPVPVEITRGIYLRCFNCGRHRLPRDVLEDVARLLENDRTRARLAYGVRKVAEGEALTAELLEQIAKRVQLPEAAERLDNLILHMAKLAPPGAVVHLHAQGMRSTVGCETPEATQWVFDEAIAAGLVRPTPPRGAVLTVEGWKYHDELLRLGTGSAHAFMAMRFVDAELDRVYRDHLVVAVAETGFELRTTNGPHQTAGSIDNRMRVEIRTSRFLVCDLTHGNRGAYWEAGFAEGLGRPVFYVCRADVLVSEDREVAPHFDTRQQLIIPWDADDPAPGMQALKDAIRATLPDVARMKD